jgi:hypothetical protein
MQALAWTVHTQRLPMQVLLVVPWVPPPEQPAIFPEGVVFSSPEEQAAYLRDDLAKRSGLPCPPDSLEVGALWPQHGVCAAAASRAALSRCGMRLLAAQAGRADLQCGAPLIRSACTPPCARSLA